MRQELSLIKYKISDSSQVVDVPHNQIDCLQSQSKSDNVPTQYSFHNLQNFINITEQPVTVDMYSPGNAFFF